MDGATLVRQACTRRHGRVHASTYHDWKELRSSHAETASAAVPAGEVSDPDLVQLTQRHAITADDQLPLFT